jgi:hypothetical protein
MRALVHLHPLPDNGLASSRTFVPRAVPPDAPEGLDFLGPVKPEAICADIAEARIDPMSHRRFVVLRLTSLQVVHVVLEGDTLVQEANLRRMSAPAALSCKPGTGSIMCHMQAGVFSHALLCHRSAIEFR